MGTFDEFVNIKPKRLLGFKDFDDRWLRYFQRLLEELGENVFGQDGMIGGKVPLSSTADDSFQMDAPDLTGTDSQGHFITAGLVTLPDGTTFDISGRGGGTHGDDGFIAFENDAADTTYYVGLEYAELPRGVQINPRTGFPEFQSFQEIIGRKLEPTAVVSAGATITLNVDSVAQRFSEDVTADLDQTGRYCFVWKKTPGLTAITESDALEFQEIFFSATTNRITTTGNFGQGATPSTDPSDYEVMILGPTVSLRDIDTETGILNLSNITANGPASTPVTFDNSDQNELVKAVLLDLAKVIFMHNGEVGLRSLAAVADLAGEPIIKGEDSGGAIIWQTDGFGSVTQARDLTIGADINTDTAAAATNTARFDLGTLNSAIYNKVYTGLSAGGGGRLTIYQKTGGEFVLAHNCTYDTATGWNRVSGGVFASKTELTPAGVEFFRKEIGPATWTDGTWDEIEQVAGATSIVTPNRMRFGLDLGDDINSAATVAERQETPRIDFGTLTGASAGNHLISVWKDDSGIGARHYTTSSGEHLFTFNSEWQSASSDYVRDSASFASQNFKLGIGGMIIECSSSSPWAAPDRTFTFNCFSGLVDLEDGFISFDNASKPAATTTPVTRRIYGNTVCKAWATITTDGASGATVDDGFNIASVDASGTNAIITMATAMSNTDYSVTAQGYSGTLTTAGFLGSGIEIIDATDFRIGFWLVTTSPAVAHQSASGDIFTFTFQVFGEQ